MLFVERNGELWGEIENICLCEHLFVFFLNFSFSVQGGKMFLFFFLLGAMHFSSPPHHIKILLKSSQNPLNPHNKKTNKTLQNITFLSLSLPYISPPSLHQKKYKNKNQKKLPQHKIYPPKTSHQNSKQNKNPKSITPLNLYKIQNSTPKTSHPKILKPYTTPKNYHHIPTLQN